MQFEIVIYFFFTQIIIEIFLQRNFGFFEPIRSLSPKDPKYRYKIKFNYKNAYFIITYLYPIKELKKFQFWKILDLQGPIFGPRSGRGNWDLRYVKL